jgi:hypothetical protein
MIAVCPNKECNQRYRIQAEMIGQSSKCKKCSTTFRIQEYVEPPKLLDLELLDDESSVPKTDDPPKAYSTISQRSEKKTKPKFRPHVVIIAALVVVVVVAIIAKIKIESLWPYENVDNWRKSWQEAIKYSSPLAPSPVVTKAKYDQILEGMSYEQVKAVIGKPGEELSRSDLAGYKTILYQWMNYNGSNMNAMFQNGRLIQKAQFGLP